MAKISSSLLASFRHQLWLENISVVEETKHELDYVFFLEEPSIMYWQLDNLRRIAPFNIATLYYEGNKVLALTILYDSL